MADRIRNTHRYFEQYRRQQAEAAFDTAERDRQSKIAQSTLDDLRLALADFILDGGNPCNVSWEFDRCIDNIEWGINRAKTADKLTQAVTTFNHRVAQFTDTLNKYREELQAATVAA